MNYNFKPNTTILVTGSAGFIGFHVTKKLLETNVNIIGLDNLNDYYDVNLKKSRNKILKEFDNYKFYKGDLKDLNFVKKVLDENPSIDKICHLAAQAGVRYSLTHPHTYIQTNIVGFTNLIDEAKNHNIKDFIYASSSSVYGKNEKIPFSVEDNVDKPISLYAASKKANELIAHSYHHLYGMNCTGLRFFTVYGPYGRPDMALFLFTKAILENKPIKVFNHGKMKRDFTYIDDIVSGILASLYKSYPYEIFNLGNHKSIELNYFIELIEKNLGKKAQKQMMDIQPGDVENTFADIKSSQEKLNFDPQTSIEDGIKKFIDWYKNYYKIK
ncbi:MAG: NAD-dependent epimerase/dehydratase family protein [Candidatus Komeilibacteria bacterium]|jgi:UDP-glucuronate 4-epimerase|nr:NAD-dependent epimerase/dehydratase family protein [Candidatus Komeilibacteria bacterium]